MEHESRRARLAPPAAVAGGDRIAKRDRSHLPSHPPPNPLAMVPDKNSSLNRLVTQVTGTRRDTAAFQILG